MIDPKAVDNNPERDGSKMIKTNRSQQFGNAYYDGVEDQEVAKARAKVELRMRDSINYEQEQKELEAAKKADQEAWELDFAKRKANGENPNYGERTPSTNYDAVMKQQDAKRIAIAEAAKNLEFED